jgi:hypothetical protein
VKGYQRVGLWNHVLIMIQKPLCPTPSAPKEMLQGGFGDFCFYEIASAVDGFGFDETTRGCGGIMTILTRWDS